MPQLRIFMKEKDYASYSVLPPEAQKRIRRRVANFVLQELNIIPKE